VAIQEWIAYNCPEKIGNALFHTHIPIIATERKWLGPINDILVAAHYWKQYNNVLQQTEKRLSVTIDRVLINTIDLFLAGLFPHFLQKLLFHYSWAGLYIHPRYIRMFRHLGVQQKRASIRDIDYLFKSKSCIGIGIFDNGIDKDLSFRIHKPVIQIPDISDNSIKKTDSLLANEIKTAADGRTIIGTIGISYYAGVIDLIKLSIAASGSAYFFVFVGQFDEDSYSHIPNEADKVLLRNFRAHPGENCIWKEYYLADEYEYNSVFNCLDIIYMMYPSHYTSSNRLTKAAYFHKFVLASNQHCVGENVKKFQLGETAEPGNIEQQQEKLASLVVSIQHKAFPYKQWVTYYTNNSEIILQKQLCRLLHI